MTTTRRTHFLSALVLAALLAAAAELSAQNPLGNCPTVGDLQIAVKGTGDSASSLPALIIRASVPGAAAGSSVLLEGKSSLDPAVPWTTVEPLTLQSKSVEWQGVAGPGSQFYRLQLPEPQVFRVEPAVGPAAGGTTLYLMGQCLGSNGSVRVGGLVIPPNTLQAGTLYSFNAPALPAGTYDVEWLEGGQVLARKYKLYSTTGEPSPVGESPQRLLEPPDEPPASPQSKKGLNAVNVKLAFVAAGDDDDDDGDWLAPALLKVKEKGNRTKSSSNLTPVGEFQRQETDLVIPGVGLDFAWVRTYRSRTGRPTPMGLNWDHSYNLFVEQDAAGIAVNDGTGRRDVYFLGTNGVYVRDEFFNEGTLSNGAFTLTFPDTGKWVFHPFDGTGLAGKISRIEDRNGNALAFHYDVQGRCDYILDMLGRTNRLSYDASGFLTNVTDFGGRVVSFGYARAIAGVTPPGVLASVTSPPVTGTPNGNDFPAGKVTRYAYSKGFADERLNQNLVSITDAKGLSWLQVVYRTNTNPATVAFDTVDYLSRGGYRTKQRRFPQTPTPANSFAVVKCIENDGAGNVTECFYDSQNRCVRQLEYTGRANPDLPTNETQNRPANKLRADDPDFFETRHEWNLDSLCTRIVHPRGNATEVVYQRAYNQNSARSNHPKRHDGDVRVIRERACCGGADTDGDGGFDLTERAWRFEYDERFGAGARVKVKFPRLDGGNEESRTGWAFGHGPRQSTALDGSRKGSPRKKAFLNQFDVELCDDFVKSATDPFGTISTASYDDHGNLLHTETTERRSGQITHADFHYDIRGRLTAMTHPADGEGCRRVDSCEYFEVPGVPGFGYLKNSTKDNGSMVCGTTDHFRLATSYEYDARGNVTRCLDPRTNDWLFTYNALDQMMTRTTPNTSFGTLVRTMTSYTYDANDNLVEVQHENRDATGALDPVNPTWSTWAEYDALDRTRLLAHELTHVVHQGGGVQARALTNRFTYDGQDNLVLEELPEAVNGNDPSNVVSHRYDERDLPFETVAAPGTGQGATTRYDYDANGNCRRVSKIDSFTIKQSFCVFDGFDRAAQFTDGMGNVELFARDRNDNLLLHRVLGETNDVPGGAGNRRLAETRWEYDGLNRRTRSRMSFFDIFTEVSLTDGESTHGFSYAPNGLLLAETDDNGNTTRYAYDGAHRLRSVTDPRTNITTCVRDGAGNVTSLTQIDRSDLSAVEQIFTTSFTYDGLSRCRSASNNVGNGTRWFYDSCDNLVSEYNARGNETVRAFDGLNRCLDTTHYDGAKERGITINTSHVEYQNNRCVSTTDGNGNTTSYGYDSLDRLVRTTHADQTVESLLWSPRSNLASRTDPNGTVTTFTHDLNDRCVRKDIAPATGVAATTTFEQFSYDGFSRLVLGTNNTSMVEFSYDSLGYCEKAKADCLAAFATFDGEGNRTALAYPGGRIVYFAYARGDLLSSVGSVPFAGGALTTLATFGYDGPGRLSRIARANGINTRLNWNGLQNPANGAGDFGFQQVVRINHARTGGNPVIDQRTFTYDRNQNKAGSLAAPFIPGGAVVSAAIRYDPLDRLTNSVRTVGGVVARTADYQLDASGNRQRVTDDGVPQDYLLNSTLPEPADFQMNQYTFTPFGGEIHDRNGNLVFRDSPTGGTMFHYDYADRLVGVERAVGPALVPVASFTYDVLGRRISKTTYPPAPAAPLTTQFIYDPDGGDIIEVRRSGAARFFAIWPHLHQTGSHIRISAAGEILYAHGDDLDNVLALTDGAGAVVERYDYDDYGSPHFLDTKGALLLGDDGQPVTSSPAGNPFLFHGMFWDGETGLYHDQGASDVNPMYEPETGRHLGRGHRDVGGYRAAAGAGAFTFAGDNPWTVRSLCAPGDCRAKARGKRFKAGADLAGSVNRSHMAGNDGGGWGYFNPKEYSISKVTVRGWDPKQKQEITGDVLKKEEGGRHTPFHHKYRPQQYQRTTDVTGEIELEAGRGLSGVQSNPLYQDSGLSGSNPLYQGRERRYHPGRPIYGNITFEGRLSNVLKTKHDTAKNSVGNIR